MIRPGHDLIPFHRTRHFTTPSKVNFVYGQHGYGVWDTIKKAASIGIPIAAGVAGLAAGAYYGKKAYNKRQETQLNKKFEQQPEFRAPSNSDFHRLLGGNIKSKLKKAAQIGLPIAAATAGLAAHHYIKNDLHHDLYIAQHGRENDPDYPVALPPGQTILDHAYQYLEDIYGKKIATHHGAPYQLNHSVRSTSTMKGKGMKKTRTSSSNKIRQRKDDRIQFSKYTKKQLEQFISKHWNKHKQPIVID